LDLCLWVLVVVVGVVVVGAALVVAVEEEAPDLPPHPVAASVLAMTTTSVRMAVCGVLLMGRVPIVACGLEISPYQSSTPAFAVE
jgi:hypothetical protein